jgi:tetratricopeptide (TPR) repeat protein
MTLSAARIRVAAMASLLLVIVGALAFLFTPAFFQNDDRLENLTPIILAGRFDEAERAVDRFLITHPESIPARLLLAQISLNRPDPKPRLAIEALDSLGTPSASLLAQIRVLQGRAFSALERNDLAERAWNEALRLDPRVPEAGWNLLGLYFVQGRRWDAHRLAMSLRKNEPDPGDRAQLLLELIRQDAQPLGADSLIKTLLPIVKARPQDLHSAVALGLALVRNSRADEGLAVLRDVKSRVPESPECWVALLLGLDEAHQSVEMTKTLTELPAGLRDDPRIERFRAACAHERQDWGEAAQRYLEAWRYDPSDFQVLYRLSRVLRAAGRLEEAARFDQLVREAKSARDQILAIYEEANAVNTLGTAPHPELYRRLAELRERMGRPDEALEWHRLVLADQPEDVISRAAERRLTQAIGERSVLTTRQNSGG